MMADMQGRPRLRITPGQATDITRAADLLDGRQAHALLADKAYDSNDSRDKIAAMTVQAVIPSKRNRKVCSPHDPNLYRHRNQIERCITRLKHVRRVPTGYNWRTINFTGFVHLAASMIWLR